MCVCGCGCFYQNTIMLYLLFRYLLFFFFGVVNNWHLSISVQFPSHVRAHSSFSSCSRNGFHSWIIQTRIQSLPSHYVWLSFLLRLCQSKPVLFSHRADLSKSPPVVLEDGPLSRPAGCSLVVSFGLSPYPMEFPVS